MEIENVVSSHSKDQYWVQSEPEIVVRRGLVKRISILILEDV